MDKIKLQLNSIEKHLVGVHANDLLQWRIPKCDVMNDTVLSFPLKVNGKHAGAARET